MTSLIIVGLARSGKDTAAKYLSKKYKLKSYTFSTVLSDIISATGEKPTKKKMIELGDKLRRENGMDAIAKMLDKKISENDGIILVGPRSPEEIEYFRKKMPEIKIIRITSENSARFLRKSSIDPQERRAFFERDERDLKAKGMQRALDAAGYEILNNSTKKSLQEQLDVLMQKIAENRL